MCWSLELEQVDTIKCQTQDLLPVEFVSLLVGIYSYQFARNNNLFVKTVSHLITQLLRILVADMFLVASHSTVCCPAK